MEAFRIAFAMYSKIPMPKVDWNKKNMRYAICYFPLVGAVIGAMSIGLCFFLERLGVGLLLKAGGLMLVPFLVTGGIHMDGFLDTVDARSSYKQREEKLEILQDPHTGAFALIGGAIYFILTFALFSEICFYEMQFLAIGYVYTRALSGLSVVTLKGAKKEGLLATFSSRSEKKRVIGSMLFYIIFCAAVLCSLDVITGIACLLTGVLLFWYYKRMSYREFGGITGDLAGFFLQLCELGLLLVVVVMKYARHFF